MTIQEAIRQVRAAMAREGIRITHVSHLEVLEAAEELVKWSESPTANNVIGFRQTSKPQQGTTDQQ